MKTALCIAALLTMFGSQSSAPQAPIVRSIDYFFATSSDPGPLYKVFRDDVFVDPAIVGGLRIRRRRAKPVGWVDAGRDTNS